MSLTRHLNYRRLLLRPTSLAVNPDLLTRLLSPSDFGPQDRWFIPPPSHANSHPQHRRASQLDRTPTSVSPFGVAPSQSVYAETDWAPVVLLGSRLGIRSDKPISRRTHSLPFPPEIISRWCARTRGDPISVNEWTSLKTLSIPFGFRLDNLCRRLSELPIPSQYVEYPMRHRALAQPEHSRT